MPGPAPKHPSRRSRARDAARSGFTALSPTARIGKPVPVWPLPPDFKLTAQLEAMRDRVAELQVQFAECTDGRRRGRLQRALDQTQLAEATMQLQLEQAGDAEVELWAQLWMMPQANVWEDAHAGREVAQYVRWKIRAEQGDLKAASEARMLSDRLGLNPLALLRLRLEIQAVDEAEQKAEERRQRSRPRRDDGDPRAALSAG